MSQRDVGRKLDVQLPESNSGLLIEGGAGGPESVKVPNSKNSANGGNMRDQETRLKSALRIPETFLGVGYTKDRAGLPLEAVRVPVPQPGPDQVLIRVAASSLNPLEYKLSDLNFFGRTPPVVLGLDLFGIVVDIGSAVRRIAVGDSVVAMADLNGDGGWAAGNAGEGSYALARDFLTVPKPESLSFLQGAAMPMCFLSAYAGLIETVQAGDTVYIPGGGGGVG